MKVLFLYNRIKNYQELSLVDSHDYGLARLCQLGVEARFLQLEHFVPDKVARLLRKVLGMHFVHLPLYPLFFGYDVVFTSTAFGSLLVHVLLKKLGLKRPKWIVLDFNLAGLVGNCLTFKQKLFYFMVAGADGIVTISEAAQIADSELWPHLKGQIKFIHFGVDTEYFKPKEVPEGDFILAIGRDPGRDYATLIEAVRGTDLTLKITAKPAQLKNLALPNNVLVCDFTDEEVPDRYAEAKLVVLPLKPRSGPTDSMGCSSLVEAMAMGKCVVVTDTKHMQSYVADGESGFLVPESDVAALRQKLLALVADKTTRDKTGKQAREFVVKNCSADQYAAALKNYLLAK